MAFDLATSLRRLKPQKRTAPLVRRPDADLMFVAEGGTGGPPLLLDTTVYIDVLQARVPQAVKDILRTRQIDHSSVAVAELTHLFGRLDPANSGTRDVLDHIRGVVDDIPPHRLSAPSIQAVAEAGMIAGVVARLRGLPKIDRQPFLNDAALFLHAREGGAILLSRNVADFDVIEQLVPSGRVLFYRQV